MSDLNVIVGLGATGVSCAEFLKRQGKSIAITDSRATPPNLAAFKQAHPNVPLSLGALDVDLLNQAANIILSPGVALSDPVIAAQVKRGVPVIGDIELFAQSVNVPVIAITGTNAKSTVTTLVGLMAKAAGYQVEVGGNLGVPALDLMGADTTVDLYVLELSSFQLETTYSLKPKVATVLNITPDHMDRYLTLEDYRQAKLRVYQHCDVVVCNRDDPLTDTKAAKKFKFTLGVPGENEFGLLSSQGEVHLALGKQLLMTVNEIPIPGKHYQSNALAAIAIGYGYGFSMEVMLRVLREFKGLPHRCELIRERNDVKWYNDSKGTNVGATQAAIEGLGSEMHGKLILILGGVGKNADFTPLLPSIKKYARHVVLIGEAADELQMLIAGSIPTSRAASMEEAVLQSDQFAKAKDAVLLSPACASFDMFKNFEHRGDVFKEIVLAL